MRIWSLHPQYLDTKGLIALWREALLAKHVLEGKTKGYKFHPQLERFKNSGNPGDAINKYLIFVYKEAEKRQFHFDRNKIIQTESPLIITVTQGQINYEFRHLIEKLKKRNIALYNIYHNTKKIVPHPVFRVIPGEIETWEKV